MAAKRLIVLRQCERMVERIREIVLDFLNDQPKSTVLVLDYDDIDLKSALFSKFTSYGLASPSLPSPSPACQRAPDTHGRRASARTASARKRSGRASTWEGGCAPHRSAERSW